MKQTSNVTPGPARPQETRTGDRRAMRARRGEPAVTPSARERARTYRMFCSRPIWSELDTTDGSW
jgi:hypothetical protein